MSLYADYLNELGVRQIIEIESGFATYKITGNECYIIDIYVRPESRKLNLAASLADMIAEKAKEAGCTYLLGSVDLNSKKCSESLKVLLAYGFKLAKCEPQGIYLVKEIV